MPPLPAEDDVRRRLIALAREIIEDETIAIDATLSLVREYGMDSLDLLDFSFNIEEVFGIRIGADELRGRAKGMMREEDMIDEDGCLSREALAIMQAQIPEIPPEMFVYGLRQEDIPGLLNINVFVRMVREKLRKD